MGDQENKIKAEQILLKTRLLDKDRKIDSLITIPNKGESLLKEIKSLFPQIQSRSYATTKQFIDSLAQPQSVAIVILSTTATISSKEEAMLYEWLKNRLNTDAIILKF